MGTHDTSKRAGVSDRKRPIAKALGRAYKLLRMGCGAQEREIRSAMQLGIAAQGGQRVQRATLSKNCLK
jgi:hypothetical protein